MQQHEKLMRFQAMEKYLLFQTKKGEFIVNKKLVFSYQWIQHIGNWLGESQISKIMNVFIVCIIKF